MQTIQLALSDAEYSQTLRRMLIEDRGFRDWRIETVLVPEPRKAGVWVIDCEALSRVTLPIPHPERVVLIAKNPAEELTRAWKAGIISVVSERDPVSTTMLAILAARYRACKSVA